MTGVGKYKGLLYLAVLLVVVPWLVYKISIVDTVKLYRESKHMEMEIEQLQNHKQMVRHNDAGAITENYSELQNGGIISNIMNSDAGSRCAVVKYTPYITEKRDGLAVHTAELVLSGAYTDLVRMIERAETVSASCRLVSVGFVSIGQRQRKQLQIHATIILQQIAKIE